MMFTNNKTYYALLFPSIKKADLKDLTNFFLKRLLHQLVFDKVINENETLVLLNRLLPIRLSRTNNDKKAIGTLNDLIFQFKVQCEYSNWSQHELPMINNRLNNGLVGASRTKQGDYGRPIEDMKALIDASS